MIFKNKQSIPGFQYVVYSATDSYHHAWHIFSSKFLKALGDYTYKHISNDLFIFLNKMIIK